MSISKNLLNKLAKIYAKSKSSVNEFGESSFSLSSSISELKVSFQPVVEELSFTLHGTTYVVRNKVYTDYRTDIYPGNIIEIESKRYLIVSVENEAGRNVVTKLFITKA